jgi:glycosyltransferase involved in cell wall biosynthesis
MPAISLILPAYNEEGAIGPVIDALKALVLDAEIIVVDDGSTDNTAAIAAEHGAVVVRQPVNCGYGRSVKKGMSYANSDVIVVSDADGTYPIECIPELLAVFHKGFDMVVGARHGAAYRQSPLKMMLRWFLRSIVEFSTGRHIPDVNSGLRVFRASTAKPYFPDLCDGFSFLTTITLVYHFTHKTVRYVPIPYNKRVGHSKVKMVRDTLRTLQYITECIVRYNPIKLFLLLSFAALIAGAIGMFWEGIGFFLIGVLAALLIFSIGLIAETSRHPRT